MGRSIGGEPVLLSFCKEEYLQAVGRELLVYNGLLVGMRTARPQRRRKMACYSADGRPYGQRAGLSCVPGGPIRLFPRVALKCNFDGGVSSGVLPTACRGGHDRPSSPYDAVPGIVITSEARRSVRLCAVASALCLGRGFPRAVAFGITKLLTLCGRRECDERGSLCGGCAPVGRSCPPLHSRR